MILSNVTKYYGKNKALESINLQFEKGRVYAVIGHNGSGKSTLFKCILSLLNFEGTIENKTINKIAYVPEKNSLYLDLSIKGHIDLYKNLHGLENQEIENILKKYGNYFLIENHLNKKIFELSKGNRQKVQFFLSLLNNPDCIIMDEPFNGMDIVFLRESKHLINHLKLKNKCILISSHQYDDLEDIADHIILLENGRLKINDSLGNLKEHYPYVYVEVLNERIIEWEKILEYEKMGKWIKYKLRKNDIDKFIRVVLKQVQSSDLKVSSLSIKDLIEHV